MGFRESGICSRAGCMVFVGTEANCGVDDVSWCWLYLVASLMVCGNACLSRALVDSPTLHSVPRHPHTCTQHIHTALNLCPSVPAHATSQSRAPARPLSCVSRFIWLYQPTGVRMATDWPVGLLYLRVPDAAKEARTGNCACKTQLSACLRLRKQERVGAVSLILLIETVCDDEFLMSILDRTDRVGGAVRVNFESQCPYFNTAVDPQVQH